MFDSVSYGSVELNCLYINLTSYESSLLLFERDLVISMQAGILGDKTHQPGVDVTSLL